jgi:hypothetical protein
MKAILIVLMVLVVSSGFAQTEEIRGNQYELKGRIISRIWRTPGCGVLPIGNVIEFRIETFSDSTYRQETIGVIFTCPELYSQGFFQAEKMYSVLVADENQADFDWVIPNKDLLTKYKLNKLLWVISVKKL